MTAELKSTFTCRECGFPPEQEMPTDACTWLWECPSCGILLQPKPAGYCCVYCSCVGVPCPR
jgi:hypothetical protein